MMFTVVHGCSPIFIDSGRARRGLVRAGVVQVYILLRSKAKKRARKQNFSLAP